ncbi:variable surface protein Vir35-like [Plasmodium vivax]|uniref:Variable surface protein Vir35-like n=1 Tax=Plasmodium vivax (strain Salvador I) TaxID=126793 RepID=A5KD60_PLAVS|nr:variable surface protein Vir35-like [Plasmodium vivax]EDL42709.1 variable surface protein Vir35-like [Plasmodium vivax]|eukprot:XP_001612502.1 variable surface protein Vir35-like [Plasmodium vivax Sal-1]
MEWYYHYNHDYAGNHNIYLNINYLKGNTLKVRNDRLLTNDDPQCEIKQSRIKENLKEPETKNKLKDITESSDIYEKANKNTSNSMHAYIKKLERGYPNKKGLKRLDCYYEKKLFDEMYKLDKISGHMKSKNSYIKKVIWKRYGFRFVIFSLVLLFEAGICIWYYFGSNMEWTKPCKTNESGPCDTCTFLRKYLLPSNIK